MMSSVIVINARRRAVIPFGRLLKFNFDISTLWARKIRGKSEFIKNRIGFNNFDMFVFQLKQIGKIFFFNICFFDLFRAANGLNYVQRLSKTTSDEKFDEKRRVMARKCK